MYIFILSFLYIYILSLTYYTTDLICPHQINENFKYNYKESHYIEILKQDAFSHSSDEEIEAQIKRNLEIMDNIIIEKDDDNE